jgi:hypothetical protein
MLPNAMAQLQKQEQATTKESGELELELNTEELQLERQLEQDLALEADVVALRVGTGAGTSWLQALQTLRETTATVTATDAPPLPPALGSSLVEEMQAALRLEEALGMRLPAMNLTRTSMSSRDLSSSSSSSRNAAATDATGSRLLFPLREARAGTGTAQSRAFA